MTILKDGNELVLECENCPETTDTYARDEFEQMVRDARANGWEIKPDRDGWRHRCPDCRQGDRLARARRLFGQV